MTSAVTIRLSSDTRAFCAVIADLRASFERLPEIAFEFGERLVHLLDTFPEALVDNLDLAPAAATGDFALTLKASDALLGFVAACRAGDAERGAIEHAFRHFEISLGCLQPTKVERVGEGSESALPGEAPGADGAE